jgi:hypothetical protein
MRYQLCILQVLQSFYQRNFEVKKNGSMEYIYIYIYMSYYDGGCRIIKY